MTTSKKNKSSQETNYLLGNKANRQNLFESIKQAENHSTKLLTPEEFKKLSDEE